MRRVALHLPDPQVDRLRAASRSTGLGVAELIRRAVDLYLPRVTVLSRQCLARLPEKDRLASEVKAWEVERNRIGVRPERSFRVADARRKLVRLYPKDPQR